MRITPLPSRWACLQMLQAFDMGQLRQTLAGPPPAHGHFKKGDAGGGEVFLEQALALGGGFFREAQLQIALGDAPPVAGHPIHQRAQHTTDRQQAGYGNCTISHNSPRPHHSGQKRGRRRFSKTRAIH
jgi:hypothetical protein